MNNEFEIFVEDVSDRSVGLQSEITLRAKLDENMVEHLVENNLLNEFEKKLKALVEEYFEPETRYKIYDTKDLEAATMELSVNPYRVNPIGTLIHPFNVAMLKIKEDDEFKFCDGRVFNPAEWNGLFQIIGNKYGGTEKEPKLPDIPGALIKVI